MIIGHPVAYEGTLRSPLWEFIYVRHLIYRVKLPYQALSPAVIRNALIEVQHIILEHQSTHKRYVISFQLSLEARKLYELMGLSSATIPYALD